MNDDSLLTNVLEADESLFIESDCDEQASIQHFLGICLCFTAAHATYSTSLITVRGV
jgi:hypothetical protein